MIVKPETILSSKTCLKRPFQRNTKISFQKTLCEYDQEIPQSQTADKPMAPRGIYQYLRTDSSHSHRGGGLNKLHWQKLRPRFYGCFRIIRGTRSNQLTYCYETQISARNSERVRAKVNT